MIAGSKHKFPARSVANRRLGTTKRTNQLAKIPPIRKPERLPGNSCSLIARWSRNASQTLPSSSRTGDLPRCFRFSPETTGRKQTARDLYVRRPFKVEDGHHLRARFKIRPCTRTPAHINVANINTSFDTTKKLKTYLGRIKEPPPSLDRTKRPFFSRRSRE